MEIKDDMLESFKLYCKIDFDFEDDLLEEMIEGCAEQVAYAIDAQPDIDSLMENKRFILAVKKQVKEEYDNRGTTSNFMRYPLANGVLNIIHQLRHRTDTDEH